MSSLCNLLLNQYLFLYIQTLHNDCSHIEDMHLLFCEIVSLFYHFGGVELRHFSHLSVRQQHFRGAKFV